MLWAAFKAIRDVSTLSVLTTQCYGLYKSHLSSQDKHQLFVKSFSRIGLVFLIWPYFWTKFAIDYHQRDQIPIARAYKDSSKYVIESYLFTAIPVAKGYHVIPF